ncbi:MAG: Holliday junction resolvase RuvX [Candidatus Berkelbacteria bacterium]|nr:Holliday junction resolvase RuvX [Candidatus Berkelbacteria bacterium]
MFLSIDYGKKRIGLALGQIFPRGMGVVDGAKIGSAIQNIAEICQKNEVEAVVLGWPIRSAGEEGTLAPEIREFGQRVSNETGLPIYLEPEQYTSTEAASFLQQNHKKPEYGQTDEIAAILILEQFLAQRREDSNLKPAIVPQEQK